MSRPAPVQKTPIKYPVQMRVAMVLAAGAYALVIVSTLGPMLTNDHPYVFAATFSGMGWSALIGVLCGKGPLAARLAPALRFAGATALPGMVIGLIAYLLFISPGRFIRAAAFSSAAECVFLFIILSSVCLHFFRKYKDFAREEAPSITDAQTSVGNDEASLTVTA